MPHIAGHVPTTGLIGAEQALQGGFGGALAGLQQGRGGALNILAGAGTQGVGALDPFAAPGAAATQLQAAFSGASGAPAQQQAFQDFQFSPGQQFLQQQGEQSLLRQASAVGGLGGGNIQKDLIRFGQGSASQALSDQLNQLNLLGGRGLQAAGQQANIFSGLGQAGAGVQERFGGGVADINLLTGQQLAGGRTRAGEQIASQIGTTTSALANLRQQQGTGLADIVGTGAGNLANILTGSGQSQSQTLQQLATLLANIGTGQGSQVAGLPGLPGTQQTSGLLAGGAASPLSGAGAAITGITGFLSDSRLKKNIQKMFTRIDGVVFYIWDWTDKAKKMVGNQPAFGVLAQEIKDIIPDAVSIGSDGFYRVDYGKIL